MSFSPDNIITVLLAVVLTVLGGTLQAIGSDAWTWIKSREKRKRTS